MTTADTGPVAGPGARPRPATSERSDFWSASLRGWDVAFYLMIAIGLAAVLLEGREPPVLPWLIGLFAALTLAYTLVGRRAARSGDRRLALAYLAVLVVLTVAIVRLDPTGSILLFLAYSQVWYFAESRRAGVAVCVVLTLGVFGAIIAYESFDPASIPSALSQGALALAFAVLLGLWVTTVAERSEERAELLVQLEAAQDELGRSHHAAGVAAERERMAQEIHDTLAQGFTSVVMLAQTASSDLRRGDPDRATDRLDLIERTARENLAEARALVAAFAPVGLDGSTLGEALERLADRFRHETGVEVDVVQPDPLTTPTLCREQEVILLRAAQEALSNVRRHADARHVLLVLRAEDAGGTTTEGGGGGPVPSGAAGWHTIELEVVDDGRGFDPAAVRGVGLAGMRERVTSGGGALDVSSSRDGTRLRVTMPVPRGLDDRSAP